MWNIHQEEKMSLTNKNTNYVLFYLLYSGLAIIIMLFNVKGKVILLIPIMFLVSIFSISAFLEFLRGGNNES